MVRVVTRGVAAVGLAVGDGDLGPGQRVERGKEPGLILFGGEHEPGSAFVQVSGVGALAVQSVGGDHELGQVHAGGGEQVEQRGEHRDLVCLGPDLDLSEHQLIAVGRRGHQV
jgi:hypothetical protein